MCEHTESVRVIDKRWWHSRLERSHRLRKIECSNLSHDKPTSFKGVVTTSPLTLCKSYMYHKSSEMIITNRCPVLKWKSVKTLTAKWPRVLSIAQYCNRSLVTVTSHYKKKSISETNENSSNKQQNTKHSISEGESVQTWYQRRRSQSTLL